MTQTIYGGKVGSELLPAGHVLSVTLDAGAGAQVQRIYGGSVVEAASLSASTTYGPYLHDMQFRVSALAGATVTVDAAPNVAANLNETQTAAAAALVSGAGMRSRLPQAARAAAVKFFSGSTSYTTAITAGAGTFKTQDVQYPAPAPFHAVRLVFANFDTAATMAVPKAKVGSPAKHLLSTGAEITWASITFGGSTSGTVPQAATGPGGQIIPGVLVSDLMPLLPTARTDGGTRPLIRVRVLVDGGGGGVTATVLVTPGATMAAYNADASNNGHQVGSYTASIDAVTTTGDAVSCLENNSGGAACVGAIFYTSTPGAAAAAFGDSLFQGNTTASPSTFAGWVVQMNWADSGMSWSSWAASGQKTADSRETLTRYLAASKPDLAVFKSWSPNDGVTQAAFDLALAYTLDMIDQCRKAGVTPVVLTSGPVNAHSGAEHARRQAQNVRTLALAASGITVVDADAVVANPANTAQILPAYDSGDGLHYNKTGHAAIAAAVRAALGY